VYLLKTICGNSSTECHETLYRLHQYHTIRSDH